MVQVLTHWQWSPLGPLVVKSRKGCVRSSAGWMGLSPCRLQRAVHVLRVPLLPMQQRVRRTYVGIDDDEVGVREVGNEAVSWNPGRSTAEGDLDEFSKVMVVVVCCAGDARRVPGLAVAHVVGSTRCVALP